MIAALKFAIRRLRRSWRSGELVIMALALVVAVAAVSAVGLFSQRVRTALVNQSGDTMGADLIFTSRDPFTADVTKFVNANATAAAQAMQFPSVVLNGDATTLASVKAVSGNYPLRGVLRITDQPFGVVRSAEGTPPRGEAWVDLKLWTALGLKSGAVVQAGASKFRVSAIVDSEPDRGGGFMDLAPRFLMNADDLPASQLLGPGSRAQYALMAVGNDTQREVLNAFTLPKGVKRVSPQDARPEVRNAINRAGQFLDIAVLAATLLAAAAIALSAHQHGTKLRDEIALLKCLGARQNFLGMALILNLLLLGLAAGIVGAAIGWAAQSVIANLLSSVLMLDLPAVSLTPLFYAWGLGLLMLLGFAVPPILQARRVTPIRVFQRDLSDSGMTRWVSFAAMLTVGALLWLQTGEAKLALYVLGGTFATLTTLAALAWLLVRTLKPLKQTVGASWRFGLGNISRRRGATVAQAVALGMALHALLLITVVRQDLLVTWRSQLPADTPNQFLINIQTEQLPALKKFFDERGYPDLEIMPMARGRLAAINGKSVTANDFDDPETQRWINRDFNLSSTDILRPDNKLTSGEWWGATGHGQKWLSLDKYAFERLKVKLGDRVTLDFAGTPVEFTVRSTRIVRWDSFKPNFFLLTPSGVLDGVPQQWITSFYLPAGKNQVLRELITAFPNVTPLDIGAAMAQVRGIMDRIINAVEFIFLFALAAGLTVLLAAIESTRSERVRETGLLRALGASSRVITRGLLAEYAVLGLLAGAVSALAAQVIAWVLAVNMFNIPYGPRPLIWLAGALTGCAIVTLLGWISLRRVLRTPPTIVLQQA
ncbi:ABC transporter permease [Stenotrophobium rhamnosiphilum]|nr:FtsX-like permease family protein [Stenotrophobium rhamnosiphilum]